MAPKAARLINLVSNVIPSLRGMEKVIRQGKAAEAGSVGSMRSNSPVNEETGDAEYDERQAGAHGHDAENWQVT